MYIYVYNLLNEKASVINFTINEEILQITFIGLPNYFCKNL